MRFEGRSTPARVLGARASLLLGLLGIALVAAPASSAGAQAGPSRRLAFAEALMAMLSTPRVVGAKS